MRPFVLHGIAWAVALVGAIAVVSAFYPPALERAQFLRELIPLDILHLSRTLTLIFGFFLIVLSRGLAKRKKRAWTLSLLTLGATMIFHLVKGLDVEEFVLTAAAALVLGRYHAYYYVESDRLVVWTSLKRLLLIALVLTLYTALGYTVLRSAYQRPPTWETIGTDYLHQSIGVGRDVLVARTAWARWFESSISVVSGVAIMLTLATVFAPALQTATLSEADRARLHTLLKSGEHGESGYYTLMMDKRVWFDDSGSHAVAYHCQGTHCVALAPLGEADQGGTMWQFQEVMARRGYQVIWYGLEEAALAPKLHHVAVKIGESAVIDLTHFSLQGAKIADVRHAVTHIEREHVTFSWYAMDELPEHHLTELDQLYTKWQHAKHAPNLTFTLGFYPFPLIPEGQVLVAEQKGALIAVLSFYPAGEGKGMVLDLMIHNPTASNGTIEAALAHAALHFQAEGQRELNLGMAPLADVTETGEQPLVKKLRNVLFDRFNRFYQYKSLYRFKNKFLPTWQPRYLYVPDYVGLPSYLTSVMLAHLKVGGRS